MVASLGYIGAQGVHLYSQRNYNTRAVVGGPSNCTSSACTFTGLPPNPAFCFPVSATCAVGTALGLDFAAPTSHSTYNGLVASLTRQFSRNLQGQVSYTYSRSIDNGSASSGSRAIRLRNHRRLQPGVRSRSEFLQRGSGVARERRLQLAVHRE